MPSLPLPPKSGSLHELTRSDSIRLFADRASHARLTFAVTEENAPAVAAICQGLDGIALAIELAAARVRMLSPERIAAELGDRFRLLSGGGRTEAPRHETMRASIDWSHDLCSEQERILLRRLSVWVGGWTLDGAEEVSPDELLDRRLVLQLLAGLVDKSLVETEERHLADELLVSRTYGALTEAAHHHMHSTVRAWQAGRARTQGVKDEVHQQASWRSARAGRRRRARRTRGGSR